MYIKQTFHVHARFVAFVNAFKHACMNVLYVNILSMHVFLCSTAGTWTLDIIAIRRFWPLFNLPIQIRLWNSNLMQFVQCLPTIAAKLSSAKLRAGVGQHEITASPTSKKPLRVVCWKQQMYWLIVQQVLPARNVPWAAQFAQRNLPAFSSIRSSENDWMPQTLFRHHHLWDQ